MWISTFLGACVRSASSLAATSTCNPCLLGASVAAGAVSLLQGLFAQVPSDHVAHMGEPSAIRTLHDLNTDADRYKVSGAWSLSRLRGAPHPVDTRTAAVLAGWTREPVKSKRRRCSPMTRPAQFCDSTTCEGVTSGSPGADRQRLLRRAKRAQFLRAGLVSQQRSSRPDRRSPATAVPQWPRRSCAGRISWACSRQSSSPSPARDRGRRPGGLTWRLPGPESSGKAP
jgi:hypothetical protein